MSQIKMELPFKLKFPKGKKVKGLIALGVFALIAVILLAGSFFTVQEQEYAVITRLGRYHTTIDGSGLTLRLPLGIDRVIKLPKLEQSIEFGYRSNPGKDTQVINRELLMLTGDLNFIDIGFAVRYKIINTKAYLYNFDDPIQTIEDTCLSVISQLVGDRKSLDIMDKERKNLGPLAIEEINQRLIKYKLGVEVNKVEIQRTLPPKELQDAFEKVNKAEQIRKQKINEGETAYNNKMPAVKGEAERLISEAEGYRQRRINQAKGDVARFNEVYAEYRKNPSLTRERIYLETMEEILQRRNGEASTVVIDRNLDSFLPIRNLSREGKNE